MTAVVIRPYGDADERGWLECRALAFLDSAFAHYTGERLDEIRARFERVHDCVLYERRFPS